MLIYIKGRKKSKTINLNLDEVINMKINVAMIAAECTGFAKVGGLGDVVNDLSHNLKDKVDSISVFLPGYADNVKAKTIYHCTVNFSKRPYIVKLKYFNHNGVSFYFIHNKTFFSGKYSNVYINSNSVKKGPFEDDARRFSFYSKAVLEILLRCDLFKNVNLLHCHDWHTGFLFLLLNYSAKFQELRNRVKTVFTIHNLNYQGIRPFVLPFDILGQSSFRSWSPVLWKRLSKNLLLQQICYPAEKQPLSKDELNHLLFKTINNPKLHGKLKNIYKFDDSIKRYLIDGTLSENEKEYIFQQLINKSCLCFNPMRAAINLSDQVNTVSKTYASEITLHDSENQACGCGLENDLNNKFINNRLTGIINGIDYDFHNPKSLIYPFDTSEKNWQNKKEEGKAKFLQEISSFTDEIYSRHKKKFFNYHQVKSHLSSVKTEEYLKKPLFVFVGRTVEQKVGILFSKENIQSIEKFLNNDAMFIFTGTGNLERNAEILNQYENCLYFNVFDDELGKMLYGYADFFLMPSYYEPCGISQLIAMRYGTLPIVHDIGGLHDTVTDNETGFKFSATQETSIFESFLKTVDRALNCFYDNGNLQHMRNTAAQVRFNWDKSTNQYLSMYKSLL